MLDIIPSQQDESSMYAGGETLLMGNMQDHQLPQNASNMMFYYQTNPSILMNNGCAPQSTTSQQSLYSVVARETKHGRIN